MANSKQAMTSLLTEHFRYTPLTLLDDIINTVNELVYRAVNAVEEGLSDATAKSLGFAERTTEVNENDNETYPDARVEIENGTHQLETLLQATVDKNFDKLEIYVLRNVLTIPEDVAPWIRLAHYEDLILPPLMPSAQQNAEQGQPPTTEALHLLRRKLTETRRLNNLLVSERTRNEAIISQLQALLRHTPPSTSTVPGVQQQHQSSQPSLSFLTSSAAAKSLNLNFSYPENHARLSTASTISVPPTPRTKASTTQALTTHTRFLVSQLPALRQLVSTLKTRMSEGGSLRYTRASGAADERREYIEGQVKKQLEGEGVDVAGGTGSGAAMGRMLAAEDIKGIEGIAEMLGSGREMRMGDLPSDGGGDPMEE